MLANIKHVVIVSLCIVISIGGTERITTFSSKILINKDSSLSVQETISVCAEGKAIRYGIYRDFPTFYRDSYGYSRSASFDMKSIQLDGKPVPYTVRPYSNGVRVRIGSADQNITHGSHTYVISYTTDLPMGFFENYDELYWNVTGNGWSLPIDKVYAKVVFPQAISKNKVRYTAYTGYRGAKDQHYKMLVHDKHSISFATTQPLQSHQGLTIVVAVPKGVVTKPLHTDTSIGFFNRSDVIPLMILIGLFLLVLLFLVISRLIKKWQEVITVQTVPPNEMTPGLLCYIMNRGRMTDCVLSVEIIQAAVEGALRIEYERSGFLSRWLPEWLYVGTYTLINTYDPSKEVSDTVQLLHNILFSGDEKSLKVTSINSACFEQAFKKLEHRYKEKAALYITEEDMSLKKFGVIYSILMLFVIVSLSTNLAIIFVPISIALALVYTIFGLTMKVYTHRGQNLVKEAKGFKQFLKSTQTDRTRLLHDISQDRMIHIYESYVPYAIGFGVGKQWFNGFIAAITAVPISWYRGYGIYRSSTVFPHRTFMSSIPLSSGSRSGFGSGGRSGGGSGGGGGGGW